MRKILNIAEVSAHVSLRGLRRLTWADTFRKYIKSPLHASRLYHTFKPFSYGCRKRQFLISSLYFKMFPALSTTINIVCENCHHGAVKYFLPTCKHV